MKTTEKLNQSLPLLLFNVIIATADIVTDLRLLIQLFLQTGASLSTLALLGPFFLNYILCFINWYFLEEKKLKTFIYPLFNVYLQFCKLISLIFN